MKVIKPQALSLLTRPFEFRREFWLGVSVMAFLPIGDMPTLLPEAAMWPFLAEELPPDVPLEAGIPKAQPEFVATAHAFAPGGRPARQLRVGVQLGRAVKTLNVFGDRFARGQRVSEPQPFTTMPLDWAHAYGGKDVAENQAGKGAAPVALPDGPALPLANVMDPKLGERGVRTPSSFGPLDVMAPSRRARAGTYDDAWLKQDFPGYPRDMDWRFFNVATADQWLREPLAGTEDYAFENLHPEEPLLRGRLPGMAARAFLVRKSAPEGFEEVALTPTTVWFFPHRKRLVLIAQGRARLAEEDGADILRAVIGADPIAAPRPPAAYKAVMEMRLDRREGGLHALRDEELVPGAWVVPDPAMAGPEDPYARVRVQFARRRRMAEREMEKTRERLREQGLDPDKFAPPPPAEPPFPKVEEIPALMEAMKAAGEARQAEAEALFAKNEEENAAALAAAGVDPKALRTAKPKGPPIWTAAAARADLEARVATMRGMGIELPQSEAELADPETETRWRKTEADLRDAYRLRAHHQDPALARPAEANAGLRALLAGGGARAHYDFSGADLARVSLAGLDLAGVCFDGANLEGADLSRCRLAGAVLAHANLEGAKLVEADFGDANLGRASLKGADLSRANLARAVLSSADLTGAVLVGANLEAARLDGVIVAGADFSAVKADGMTALNLALGGLRAPGISLVKAKFIECDMQKTDLSASVMDGASFIGCNLSGAVLAGARLARAAFVQDCKLVDANLARADLAGANLRETDLRRAFLDGAILEQADFSGADLTDASLKGIAGAGLRLVATRLAGAQLAGANLMAADFSRADMREADLSQVNAYEANAARVRLDAETRRRGMVTTRMRYLPLAANDAQ